MTNEEAIIDIRENIQPIIGGKSLDIAISAIEKQIPKKPLHWDDCEQFYIECPCCGKRYDSRLGYKGCPYCLQAIRLEGYRMTCKDCLHYERCKKLGIFNVETLSVCEDFTDRSEWVHLPCKVGTAVYIPEIEVDKIERKLVTKIYRTTVDEYSVNARYIMYHTRKGNNFTDSMLGKTVFLTREEAEKALEECDL